MWVSSFPFWSDPLDLVAVQTVASGVRTSTARTPGGGERSNSLGSKAACGIRALRSRLEARLVRREIQFRYEIHLTEGFHFSKSEPEPSWLELGCLASAPEKPDSDATGEGASFDVSWASFHFLYPSTGFVTMRELKPSKKRALSVQHNDFWNYWSFLLYSAICVYIDPEDP
ncbi:hypothetical protein ZTR_09485 [Talaromyces verruculosus]|nr:hypothetical protein ZTR_09485 [Talaromyces verruculosus]